MDLIAKRYGELIEEQRQRIKYDSFFRLEMQFCNEAGLPHGAFLRWSLTDRAKALGLMLAKATECVLCGTDSEEWDKDEFAYVAVRRDCRGCMVKDVESDSLENRKGSTIEMVRNTRLQRAKKHLELTARWLRKDKG